MALGEIKALLFADGIEVSPATAAPAGLSFYYTDAVTWDGVAVTKSYNLAVVDDNGNTVAAAKTMIWQLKLLSTGEVQTGCVIDHPDDTHVRFTFGGGYPPSAGTYILVGR